MIITTASQPIAFLAVHRTTRLGPGWRSKSAKVVGSLVLVLAAMGFVINCTWLALPNEFRSNSNASGVSGVAIWAGLLFFLPSGLLCLLAGLRNRYGLVVGTLVMSIISILTGVLPMLSLASTGVAAYRRESSGPDYQAGFILLFAPVKSPPPTYHLAFGIIFIILALILGALLVAASVLSCMGLSGTSNVDVAYPMGTHQQSTMSISYPVATHQQGAVEFSYPMAGHQQNAYAYMQQPAPSPMYAPATTFAPQPVLKPDEASLYGYAPPTYLQAVNYGST